MMVLMKIMGVKFDGVILTGRRRAACLTTGLQCRPEQWTLELPVPNDFFPSRMV